LASRFYFTCASVAGSQLSLAASRWIRPINPKNCKFWVVFRRDIAKCYIKESGITIAQDRFKRDIASSVT
jgi:hypothetical protein